MAERITIDGDEYLLDSLPETVKETLSLMQMSQQRVMQARANLQIEDAAMNSLGQRLRTQLEDVDPIPGPVVNTGVAANRKTRRAVKSK